MQSDSMAGANANARCGTIRSIHMTILALRAGSIAGLEGGICIKYCCGSRATLNMHAHELTD